MNILIDCSHIKRLPTCAVSLHLYAGRLMQGLNSREDVHPIVLTHKGMEAYIDSLAGFCVDKILVDGSEKRLPSTKLDRLLGLIPRSLEQQLQERRICAVITPDFSPYAYSFPKRYHQHLVIHDLIRVHRPRGGGPDYYRLMFKWLASRVPHIIAISDATRQSLKAWCGRDATVIHNSIPFDFACPEQPVDALVGRPYILDVNRFDFYKNPETLVAAFNSIKDRIPHQLYFKGLADRGNTDICHLKEYIAQLQLEDRVILDTSNRTEAEMRWLYSHASLFVTPSLEEGFGYTPIEAAILKTPVLVSDIATLREVTQGRVPTFNPHDAEELASKMLALLTTPPTAQERQATAAFFLQEYSLERQTEQFVTLIKSNTAPT